VLDDREEQAGDAGREHPDSGIVGGKAELELVGEMTRDEPLGVVEEVGNAVVSSPVMVNPPDRRPTGWTEGSTR
jgi:hypothetical protein